MKNNNGEDVRTRRRCAPELLARVFHEVRNGLSAVKLNLSLIEAQTESNGRVVAMRQALRELELIDEAVHMLVRLDLGRFEPEIGETDIRDVISLEADEAYASGIRNALNQRVEALGEIPAVHTDARLARMAVAMVLRNLRAIASAEPIVVEVKPDETTTRLRFVLASVEVGVSERNDLIAGGDLHGGLGLTIAMQLMRDVQASLSIAKVSPSGTAVDLEFPSACS